MRHGQIFLQQLHHFTLPPVPIGVAFSPHPRQHLLLFLFLIICHQFFKEHFHSKKCPLSTLLLPNLSSSSVDTSPIVVTFPFPPTHPLCGASILPGSPGASQQVCTSASASRTQCGAYVDFPCVAPTQASSESSATGRIIRSLPTWVEGK